MHLLRIVVCRYLAIVTSFSGRRHCRYHHSRLTVSR
jgi:hypothetical protein